MRMCKMFLYIFLTRNNPFTLKTGMINNNVTTKKNKVYYISVKYFLEINTKKAV